MRLLVMIAGGCWMLGEGARMVVMALFFQNWYYVPNMFDMFFDWAPLTILGLILLYEGINSFYIGRVDEQKKSRENALLAVKKGNGDRFKATRYPK